jgi:hypothetical protein
MNVTIRPETSTDHEAMRPVNRLAFGQDAEARLVDALWDGGYVRVSLVAEQAGQVVGPIRWPRLLPGAPARRCPAPPPARRSQTRPTHLPGRPPSRRKKGDIHPFGNERPLVRRGRDSNPR